MNYRKKPVVIEAFKLGFDVLPDWFINKVKDGSVILNHNPAHSDLFGLQQASETTCSIATLEGTMKGNHGDYIIKGVSGEVYPCKPDIFEKTYESATLDVVVQIKLRDYKALFPEGARYVRDCLYGRKGDIKTTVLTIYVTTVVELEGLPARQINEFVANNDTRYDDYIVTSQITYRTSAFGDTHTKAYITKG